MSSPLHPVATFDAPQVFDASVSSIPGSASSPVQVVASLSAKVYGLQFFDGIGGYVGVYKGASGSETLVCVIGGGTMGMVEFGAIPSGTRISLKSMGSAAITTGTLFVHFMGRT
jgi:hypothetical protein